MIDPPYRYFHLLSKDEAKAILEVYVATLPERVDAFLDEVRRRGEPVEALDFSRSSMRPLWAWFIASLPSPGVPASDEAMRSGDHRPPRSDCVVATNGSLVAYITRGDLRHRRVSSAGWGNA